ncbi:MULTISPECIES: undecaprenyl-diphosphate phosphatase [Sinomonas]|uniref:Undecaprenyl-diphosphatase n=1 Tax=Sinomonas flava TaxID=496857 RepID=A0ABN3BKY8_9MICC|nr:undecaprenyl-diphosphate phosphatase [Sinomonas sp. R1AF57]ASN51961.1 UDP-diphosphatase [Sinomonas sp. R1AF57]
MNYLEAAFLGLIQGLTEFLPISSSAHLRIVGEFLPNAEDPGAAFTAITQLGTETAVIIYFWRDIVRIIGAWFASLTGRIPRNDPDARMGWLVIIGSVPIVILGLLFQDQIETVFRSLWLTATTLIVFGLILATADALGRHVRTLDRLGTRHGVIYGFAQALALIPGVSRSGGTITAGLFMGYTREAAARYSFLLAIPAVFGSGLYQLAKSLRDGFGSGPYGLGETAVATVIAFVVGFVIIGWFMRYISSRSYRLFVWYRIGLGAALYVLLGFGVISAGH